MKKRCFVLLILVLLLSFAAVQADDLSDIKQSGVLKLGVPPEYIPFVFFDEAGCQTGIDVALMTEVGRRMGVLVETVSLAFDGMIDSLNIGQVDVIGGAFSKTEERMEVIDFTRVYYNGEAQFIGLSTLSKPQSVSLESFRNLKIGVQKGTSFDQWVKTNLVGAGYVSIRNVYPYSSAAEEMKALDRGDVDLVMIDQDVYEDLYRDTGRYQIFYDGFAKENYAFGCRKNSTLTAEINSYLTDMMKDGTAQAIADRFFRMNFNEANVINSRSSQIPTAVPAVPVVVVPTAAPSSACVNSMSFLSDVTITDGHQVSPGERFRKIWRVYNNGTCTWTPDYSFGYVSGDQMSGQSVRIPGTVLPGQTIDLAVDLIAPYSDGTYRGYWQMRSPQGTNFGQTIWVKVRVKGSSPQPVNPTPRPTEEGQHYVPIDIYSFYPDYYSGEAGNCTTVYWSVSGASMVDVTVDGVSMYRGTSLNGAQQICGPLCSSGSHDVQLYAFNVTTDAYASFNYVTKEEEGQHRVIPVINYFYPESDSGTDGRCVTVYWSTTDSAGVDIMVDGTIEERSSDSDGSTVVCGALIETGYHTVTLTAHTVTDDATSSFGYTTIEYQDDTGDDWEDEGGWAGSNYYDNEG